MGHGLIPKGRRWQPLYRRLHALSLVGMNYGGTIYEAGDRVAIRMTGEHPVVLDGGAHVGEYVQGVLDARPRAAIHAFEPGADTFAALGRRFPHGVHLHNYGLSDSEGDASWYVDGKLAFGASLFPQERRNWQHHDGFERVGKVKIRTIDSVCAEEGIDRIDLLKLDIEGAELAALKGARRMLNRKRIGLIQFEFGLPAMAAGVYLRDFFELLDGWDIHRIVNDGVVRIRYHERWEILWTANYLAVPRS
jgi:FkbM family methyltransferase